MQTIVGAYTTSRSATLDLFDESMSTPLFLCVANKKATAVEALLASGKCDPNTMSGPRPSSDSALVLACELGHDVIVDLLLAGATICMTEAIMANFSSFQLKQILTPLARPRSAWRK